MVNSGEVHAGNKETKMERGNKVGLSKRQKTKVIMTQGEPYRLSSLYSSTVDGAIEFKTAIELFF